MTVFPRWLRRDGPRRAPIRLTPEELTEFRCRTRALADAQTTFRMLQEASLVFARTLQQKYGLPDDFRVHPRTGKVIVPEAEHRA